MHTLAAILILALAPPKVSEVVVYPDRAQVTRTVSIACGPRALATFTGIPPAADASTFRARASGGTIEGLRSEERTRAETFAVEVKDLDAKIRKLEGEVRVQRDGVRRIAGANQGTGGENGV